MTVPEVVRENFGLMDSQQSNPISTPVIFPGEIPHPVIRMVTHHYHLTKGEVDNHP